MWGIHFRFSEKKKKRMPEQFLCDLLEFGIVKAVGKGILAGNTHDVAFFFLIVKSYAPFLGPLFQLLEVLVM